MFELYEMLGVTSGFMGFLLFLFFLYLSILWCLLPFAIFGIKSLLRKMVANQEKELEWFEMLYKQNKQLIVIASNLNADEVINLTEEVMKE